MSEVSSYKRNKCLTHDDKDSGPLAPQWESVKLNSPDWSTASPGQRISATRRWEPVLPNPSIFFSEEAPNPDVYVKSPDFKMLVTNLRVFNNEKFHFIFCNETHL